MYTARPTSYALCMRSWSPDACAYHATIQVQQDHLKKNVETEQGFKQHAIREFNVLHASAVVDSATLQGRLEVGHAQLAYVSRQEKGLLAMLRLSENNCANLQFGGQRAIRCLPKPVSKDEQ